MSNYWIQLREKRIIVKEINFLLLKFVGRKSAPIDKLFYDMRKIVLKYFKNNLDKLKYFAPKNQSFDYDFIVHEQGGHITEINFKVKS